MLTEEISTCRCAPCVPQLAGRPDTWGKLSVKARIVTSPAGRVNNLTSGGATGTGPVADDVLPELEDATPVAGFGVPAPLLAELGAAAPVAVWVTGEELPDTTKPTPNPKPRATVAATAAVPQRFRPARATIARSSSGPGADSLPTPSRS
jgi:hypothetical protein